MVTTILLWAPLCRPHWPALWSALRRPNCSQVLYTISSRQQVGSTESLQTSRLNAAKWKRRKYFLKLTQQVAAQVGSRARSSLALPPPKHLHASVRAFVAVQSWCVFLLTFAKAFQLISTLNLPNVNFQPLYRAMPSSVRHSAASFTGLLLGIAYVHFLWVPSSCWTSDKREVKSWPTM